MRVVDGLGEVPVRALVHADLRVLVGGQQLVPAKAGEVGRVNSLVVLELSQSRSFILNVPHIPDLDNVVHTRGDKHPRLPTAELYKVAFRLVQPLVPDRFSFQTEESDRSVVPASDYSFARKVDIRGLH